MQTDGGPGTVTLLWPSDWSLRASGGEVIVVDGTEQAVARLGDEVSLRGRAMPQSMDFAAYRQLVDELPGDCVRASWLVGVLE